MSKMDKLLKRRTILTRVSRATLATSSPAAGIAGSTDLHRAADDHAHAGPWTAAATGPDAGVPRGSDVRHGATASSGTRGATRTVAIVGEEM
jgi:hypothetical protein